jgi:alpha-galactosidase/6-phospho-beta-glucosidase family protein
MKTFTIIGAGGIFTCGLLAYFGRDSVRLRSELGSETIRLVLMDIDEKRLDRTQRLGERILEESHLAPHIQLVSQTDLKASLIDTELVLVIRSFRPQMSRNVELAQKYGVPGGDEGPAALGLARLVAPQVESIATTLREVGKPGARLLIFSNPTDLLAAVVTEKTGVESWGWCGAPDSLRENMAQFMQIPIQSITRLRSVGVNHFSYVTEFEVEGRPALEAFRAFCRREAPRQVSERVRLWMEWVRDTGWPYLTVGHPAPWNGPFLPNAMWDNPEAGGMVAAIDRELGHARVDVELLIETFGWEGTTGRAISHLIGALWGKGHYEVAWQGRHAGNIPGLPEGSWLEHTMRVEQGHVFSVDFKPLPDELRAQISLLALQNQAMVRAVITDDLDQGIRALAINPFTCDLPKARAYLREIWAG